MKIGTIIIIALLAFMVLTLGCLESGPLCGDGVCDEKEDYYSCPADCATEPSGCVDQCGDNVCAENVCLGPNCPCAETPKNCPADCVAEITS